MGISNAKDDRNVLERFLCLFANVRGGEGATAVLLTLNVFILMLAYYIIKPVREALILAGQGAEIKAYTSAGQAILLLGAVPLYALLAGRFPRRRLINVVTAFFIACLGVFYILGQLRVPLGIGFFVWVGIFNVMVIAQFWSFANDLYTQEAGKRIFAIIAFGAASGAVFGSFMFCIYWRRNLAMAMTSCVRLKNERNAGGAQTQVRFIHCCLWLARCLVWGLLSPTL